MRFFPSKQLFRILAILLALALTASACGSDGADETSAVETADTSEMQDTEEPADTGDDFSGFSVVMILDGSAQDGGWNSTHVRGGDKVEAAFPGINIEYVEEVAPGQTATNAFQDAVDGGADVVIGTTYYQDDMMDVAAANLETTFLTWAGFTTADNVGHFDGASEDGRYLDGLVAGSLTKSGIIGYPVGFPFNEVNQ
jgi:basic membrane protein A